jgi:hypothetical protein
MDVYLITMELPVAEAAVPLADHVQQCEWLFDTDTLAGAIQYDLTGLYLQCSELATHSGIVPALTAEEPDFLVQLCAQHWRAAKAEGLREAVTL